MINIEMSELSAMIYTEYARRERLSSKESLLIVCNFKNIVKIKKLLAGFYRIMKNLGLLIGFATRRFVFD